MLKAALALCILVLLSLGLWKLYQARTADTRLTVGFIYDNDETTPYSYSFYLAQEAVQDAYPNRVRTMMVSNIMDDQIADSVDKLAEEGCRIIFTNSYGDMRSVAASYPDIQFCQASNQNTGGSVPPNYHTFKGEIYQGRYASGVVAGLKLREMIQGGRLTPEQAMLGFVGAYPYPEVISGYTAFLLGVRSVVPQAVMRVKYTGIWESYLLEKSCAQELLEEGCVIIAQHSDTVGPAIACEECFGREVYHIGFNIDMTDVAPHTSLTGTRVNWTPYVLQAVKAVMDSRRIESSVVGHLHPNQDMSAGVAEDWVQLTGLNRDLLPEGAEAVIDQTLEQLREGSIQVFSGSYVGVNPEDPSDTVDLSEGFEENSQSSVPSFHYILRDIITIEE